MKSICILIAMMFAYANVIGQDKNIVTWLTFDQAQEGFPTWSPDGKRIAFTSTRSGNFDIWILNIDIEQITKALAKLNDNEITR